MFEISVIGPATHDEETLCAQITIGEFSEEIVISVRAWNIADYRHSWLEAGARLLSDGFGRFVVSAEGSFYWTWPCWREGDAVVFRNQILPAGQVRKITQSCPIEHYDDGRRGLVGEAISEWPCAAEDVAAFISRTISPRN